VGGFLSPAAGRQFRSGANRGSGARRDVVAFPISVSILMILRSGATLREKCSAVPAEGTRDARREARDYEEASFTAAYRHHSRLASRASHAAFNFFPKLCPIRENDH